LICEQQHLSSSDRRSQSFRKRALRLQKDSAIAQPF
jgi:hypothetical protein